MTTNQRLHFGEMLRRAREERFLALAAATAVLERRRRARRTRLRFVSTAVERRTDLLIEHESSTLVAIERALRVLRQYPDLYGTCVECGASISPARLDGAPWTTECGAHNPAIQ